MGSSPKIVDTDRQKQTHRTRASEAAIRAALRAIKGAGLPVDKVCVSGGSIEIHCGTIEARKTDEKDGGLEEW